MKTSCNLMLLILGLILVVLTFTVSAQTPKLLNYQGKLVNQNGTSVSGTYAMTFSIYSSATGGTALWQDPGRAITVVNGIFNVLLGSGVSFSENLFTGDGERYLGIKVGNDAEMTPRFQFTSVGYAIRAAEADGVKDRAITNSKIVDGAITQQKLAVGITDNDWTISGNNMYSAVSGNAGIGTPTPSQKLDVAGTVQMTGFRMPFGAANNYVLTSDASGIGFWKPIPIPATIVSGSGALNYLPKFTGTTTIGNSILAEINGKIGIGNTNPRGKVEITDGNLIFSNSPRTTNWALGTETYSTYHVFYIDEYTAARWFFIRSGGNVGIGRNSSNPTNILTIERSSATDPIADAWTVYSSRRWKTNIQPIQNALDQVKQLQGVRFDWKATGKSDIGLIAEDVSKVVPEVVAYEENGVDAQSVDYARLVSVLIEGMKAQQKVIEQQQKINEQQQQKLDELIQKFNQLGK